MSHLLPRFTAISQRIEDERRIAEIVLEASDATVPTVVRATLGGDDRRLRGIPCIARGVGGTSPGTSPPAALERTWRGL